MVHSIDTLAKIFEVSTEDITDNRDCFSGFAYGDGNDGEVFEYIRSLCAVHPTDTSMHIQLRILWGRSFIILRIW